MFSCDLATRSEKLILCAEVNSVHALVFVYIKAMTFA